MFSDDFATSHYLEQKRQAIHKSVRAEHLANRLHRQQKHDRTTNWMHVLSRLHRIRIQISFDLEEAAPEPEGAGC